MAAECAPFAKTGGLGDAIGGLARALARLGIDVRVVLPLYRGLPWDDFEPVEGPLAVPMWYGTAYAAVRRAVLPRSRVRVYFLEHHGYWDRPYVYGPPEDAYPDNLERFAFLSRAALALTGLLDWWPDAVHAHDWHAALVPLYLRAAPAAAPLAACASVYTIHNFTYQGAFAGADFFVVDLGPEYYAADALEHFGTLNLTKGALLHATMLTTVSPTYADEIRTSALGCGLDGVLRGRGADLVGILNGIDVEEWNPATDRHLPAHFDAADPRGKSACKAALQEEAGLPIRPDLPLFAAVTRLTAQKGMDVLVEALARVLGWELQLVVLGSGDPALERRLAGFAAAHPRRCAVWLGFDEARAHRIEAAADFFVMPSRFEPCGLSQLYSLRYGALPIARRTGGLGDTIESFDERAGTGTGFLFDDLDPQSLANTIGWALATWYQRRRDVERMRARAMALDLSWDRAAGAYVDVYRAAQARRRR